MEPVKKTYISLSESEEEEAKPLTAPAQPIVLDDDVIISEPHKPRPVEIEHDASDEEFPELVHQARERERLKVLQRQNASKSLEERNHTSSIDDDIFQTGSAIANIDPIVELLITSQIEGMKPLMIKRKLSQRFKEVRLAWCDSQEAMPSHVKDSIFLSWRGKRLYDVTTCKSFNLDIDSQGKISSQGDGVDTHGRIHLEAWTEQVFNAYLKREQDGGQEVEVVEEKVAIQKTRIILKSREVGEFKLYVKPSTMIRKVLDAFRQNKELSEKQEVSLHFDGDVLEPDSRIGDYELEDMDTVEVHVR